MNLYRIANVSIWGIYSRIYPFALPIGNSHVEFIAAFGFLSLVPFYSAAFPERSSIDWNLQLRRIVNHVSGVVDARICLRAN